MTQDEEVKKEKISIWVDVLLIWRSIANILFRYFEKFVTFSKLFPTPINVPKLIKLQRQQTHAKLLRKTHLVYKTQLVYKTHLFTL